MSTLIGYWTDVTDDQSSEELRQLLLTSVSQLNRPELKTAATNFGIAVHGRHTTTHTAATGFTAALAAAGEGFEPDIWARCTGTTLALGRDIFGRAPLFWTVIKNAVWFSNRLQLLLRVKRDPGISIEGFYSFGCFSYVPAPQTPFENVIAVSAGTELTWKTVHPAPASKLLHQWREAEEQSEDEPTEARRLRRLLEESVEAQLRNYSGEPVGVFLSGGLDSSLTAALLARAGVRVRGYTLDFKADCLSETSYAEHVAGTLGIPLTKIPVSAASMRRGLEGTAERLDGLFGDGVTVPLATLYERASEEVRTVFNGEGGDQLFGGWTNKPLIAASVYEGPEFFMDSYLRTFHRFHGHDTAVYEQSVLRDINSTAFIAPLQKALDASCSRSLLHRLRRANLLLKGADNIQPRASNLGLSYNLEVRTIFCSLPLAEWTFGVSGKLWLRGGCEKYLLKRGVEDILPANIVWREKRGMGVPLSEWLTGPLRRWCLKQLHPLLIASEGLWQADLARRISAGELSGHLQGRRIGETLWLMLMWRAWREHFLPTKSPAFKGLSTKRWQFSTLATTLKRTSS